MTLNPNQFRQEQLAGNVVLKSLPILSAKIKTGETSAILPSRAVKLVATSKTLPIVTAVESATDDIFGFALRNIKDADYPADAILEVATEGAVVSMTAGSTITAGQKLEYVVATGKVIPNAGVNPICGYALDSASTDEIVSMVVITPAYSSSASDLKIAVVSATLAEINAGKVLIAGSVGKKILVSDITARVNGTFTTATSIDIESTNASPVLVNVGLIAGITNGAVLKPGDANFSRGAGYATELGVDDGIRVIKKGSNAAGGTSIQYTITYRQI